MLDLWEIPIASTDLEDGCSSIDRSSDPCALSSLREVAAVKQGESAKVSEAFGSIDVFAGAELVGMDELVLAHSSPAGQHCWECSDGDRWQKLGGRAGWVVKVLTRPRPEWEQRMGWAQRPQCSAFASRCQAAYLTFLESVNMLVEAHRVAERETIQIRRDVVHGSMIAPTALEKWAARTTWEEMTMPQSRPDRRLEQGVDCFLAPRSVSRVFEEDCLPAPVVAVVERHTEQLVAGRPGFGLASWSESQCRRCQRQHTEPQCRSVVAERDRRWEFQEGEVSPSELLLSRWKLLN